MNFAAITLCVASQRVFVVVSLSTQFGNFWIHPPIYYGFWRAVLSKAKKHEKIC
jgi:hypothetical protein